MESGAYKHWPATLQYYPPYHHRRQIFELRWVTRVAFRLLFRKDYGLE